MGCWHETCAISKLPIHVGDKAVIIPLLKNYESVGRCCYFDGAFKRFGLPIFGEYNDYGSVENTLDDELHLEFINSREIFKDDELVKYDKLEDFLDDIVSREITSKDIPFGTHIFNNNNINISYTIMLEEMYWCVINAIKDRIPYEETYSIRELRASKFDTTIELMKQEIQDYDIISSSFDYINGITTMYTYKSHLGDNLEWFIWNYIQSNSPVIKEKILDIMMFELGVSYGRGGYHATSGCGSQSDEMYIQKQIALKTLEIINRQIVERFECDKDNEECLKETILWWNED